MASSVRSVSPGRYSWRAPELGNADPAPAGAIRAFDLGFEAQALAPESNPERRGRTIAQLETLRLTMMRLKSGSVVRQHKTDCEISIQTVSGDVVLHGSRDHVELPAGHLALLERDAAYDIEALEDSSILITVCVTAVH